MTKIELIAALDEREIECNKLNKEVSFLRNIKEKLLFVRELENEGHDGFTLLAHYRNISEEIIKVYVTPE